ncbi:MAG: hypothetical protein P4K93_12195 [Terracidiphilus sp.]|nr:hypothetical protein [Terracidiphilus sp.]MDR3798912.1 hypothetical protein [Terracidiphilus sp.]
MPFIRTLIGLLCASVLCVCLHAQTENTIHIRLLDGKTGQPVKASNYLVRIDHHDTAHNDWVKINDDGTVLVTLPSDAREIAVKATYDMSTETYINCDIAKESDKQRDTWYPIAQILKSGVVTPNECSQTHYTAKPGEFVFFVRKLNWRELEN